MEQNYWHEWKELNLERFEKIDKNESVVMVSCSPLEVHGPHLPFVTDIQESEDLLYRMAVKIHAVSPKTQFLHLPPLYVATDVLPHAGSINFRTSTIVRVLEDLGRSLAKQGFRQIWVCNFHGGPRHFVSIEEACVSVSQKYNVQMIPIFSLVLKKLTNGTLGLADVLGKIDGITLEDIEGDQHAGLIETSLMLCQHESLISESFKELPEIKVKHHKIGQIKGTLLSLEKFKKQKENFSRSMKFYQTETYSGIPSKASKEIGEQIFEVLSSYGSEYLLEVLEGKITAKESCSPLWKVRWLLRYRIFSWLFEKSLGIQSKVW